jgi:hypothetical protein
MTGQQELVLGVAVGAALIALWLFVRLGGRAPRSVWTGLLCGVSAIVVVDLLPAALHLVIAGSDSPLRKGFAVFTVLLPGMTYVWLASIWMIGTFQRTCGLRL